MKVGVCLVPYILCGTFLDTCIIIEYKEVVEVNFVKVCWIDIITVYISD